jgi:hypothetical protein
MNELPTNKFQWKWVWISLSMYIVFYFLPLAFIPGGVLSETSRTKPPGYFVVLWLFAGPLLISAVAGFLSKGITIKEPTLAAVGLMFLWNIAVQLRLNSAFRFSTRNLLQILVGLVTVALLAFIGAWLGERIQNTEKVQTKQQDLPTTSNDSRAAP